MRRSMSFTIVLLFVVTLASCGTPAAVPPTATLPQAKATRQQAAATVTQIAETAVADTTREPVPFPLSEPGPYYTGKRTYTFEDASRDGREIGVTVIYPAVLPEGSTGDKLQAGANRDPALNGAPYPLILRGH